MLWCTLLHVRSRTGHNVQCFFAPLSLLSIYLPTTSTNHRPAAPRRTECVRLQNFVQDAEIVNNTVKNCGVYDFGFSQGDQNGEGIYIGTSSLQVRKNRRNPLQKCLQYFRRRTDLGEAYHGRDSTLGPRQMILTDGMLLKGTDTSLRSQSYFWNNIYNEGLLIF